MQTPCLVHLRDQNDKVDKCGRYCLGAFEDAMPSSDGRYFSSRNPDASLWLAVTEREELCNVSTAACRVRKILTAMTEVPVLERQS